MNSDDLYKDLRSFSKLHADFIVLRTPRIINSNLRFIGLSLDSMDYINISIDDGQKFHIKFLTYKYEK